jgi:uncharacterized protein (TIGR00255 family)
MKSMTGYGYNEFQNDKISLVVELKSYNNRYLDMNMNMPSFLSPLEPDLRNYISARIERGKVDFNLRVKEIEENVTIRIDKAVASASIEALKELSELAGLEKEVSLSNIMRMEGVFKKIKTRDLDSYKDIIYSMLEETFKQYDENRDREAGKTYDDVIAKLNVIEETVDQIENNAESLEEDIKNNLRDKFKDLLGNNIDETRIYTETAVMLVRFSINEEIVRLRSHIEGFRKTIDSGDTLVGKKLDFICQEMNREINTIGSKSIKIEINQGIVNARDALENIREQVRNIA